MQVNSVGGINARALIRFVFRLPAGLPRRSPSSSFPLPFALIGAMKRIVVRPILLLLLCPLLLNVMKKIIERLAGKRGAAGNRVSPIFFTR